MPDTPEVAKAKAKLRELVVPAVETLEDLVHSDHAGVRLGAAREILDRGGVPAKQDLNVHVDLTLDDEIEQLIIGVRRQFEHKQVSVAELDIEDAVIVDEELEPAEVPLGDKVVELINAPVIAMEDEQVDDSAWWQANPNEE